MGGGNDTNIEGWTSDGLLLLFLFMFGSKIIADCDRLLPIALDWIKDLLACCWWREEFNKVDDEDAYILPYFCEAKIQSAIYSLLL